MRWDRTHDQRCLYVKRMLGAFFAVCEVGWLSTARGDYLCRKELRQPGMDKCASIRLWLRHAQAGFGETFPVVPSVDQCYARLLPLAY